jgi:catechol 2,3-dioxygenase-like lactoylglutathione lyase family enzyme
MRIPSVLGLVIAVTAVLAAGACKRHEAPERFAALVQQCTTKDLGCPRTIFYVRDLVASQRYYRDQLGFKVDWTDGDPADFGAVSRGDTQLFMCERCQGHPGSWLWVFTPNVDKLYAEIKQRGAIIKSAPANMPWHIREMQVADPDGNVLRIGSAIEH